jgi:hypothetical protein
VIAACNTAKQDAGNLRSLADALEQDCQRLLTLLSDLEQARADGVERAYRERARNARLIRARITATSTSLERSRHEVERLAPDARLYVRSRVAESRRMLQEAGEGYSRLVNRIADAMALVRQQIADVRQGSKAVRSYALAARARP